MSSSPPPGASRPSRCRNSLIAVRPLASTASRASRASSGELSSTLRAAPACTTITLTLWVTTSCSSPAIRARSASTARRVCASCSASARSSRWAESPARFRHPRIPTATAAVGANISSAVNRAGTCGVVSGNAAVAMTAAVPTASSAAQRNRL